MKNVRKMISLFLSLILALASVPALAGDEDLNVSEYLAELGLEFSYVGELEHPDVPGLICQVWQREYGTSGRLWLPAENCTLAGISDVIANSRTFFFPWETEGENEAFWSLDFLETQGMTGIDAYLGTWGMEEGLYLRNEKNGMLFFTAEEDGKFIVSDDGTILIKDSLITSVVTGGKYY